MLAELQRGYKKQDGIEIPRSRELSFSCYKSEGETPEEYYFRHKRASKFDLISYFSIDVIRLSNARARNEKY